MLATRRIIYGECRPTLAGMRDARLQLAERLVEHTLRAPDLPIRAVDRIILGFVEYVTNLIEHGHPPPLRIIYELMVNDDNKYELHIWDDGGPFDTFNQELINQRRRSANQRGQGHHHGLYLLMQCFDQIRYIPCRPFTPFNHIRLGQINEQA